MKKNRNRRLFKIAIWAVVGIAALLLFLEFGLAPILKHQMNQQLAKLPDHRGNISDVDIRFWKGEITINDISIIQKWHPKDLPVFVAHRLQMQLAWSALFKGRIEAKLNILDPTVLFIPGITEPSGRPKKVAEQKLKTWRDAIQELMPVTIHELKIENGTILFRFPRKEKEDIDIKSTNVFVVVKNLTNRPQWPEGYPATAHTIARLPGKGNMEVDVKFDPLRKPLAFDTDVKIEHVDLTAFNKLFQEYAKFDLEKGRFDFAAEMATKNDYVKGYVKPLFSDIEVLGAKDKHRNPFRIFWEAIVGTGVEVMKNLPKDRLAAKIPFEGKLDSPDVDIWSAVVSVIHNALIKALTPSLEHRIGLK